MIRTAPSLCVLTALALGSGCVATATAQVQRLPRQAAPATAAIQGIARTEQGLGLGGVTVVLQNLANGRSLSATTTGDGVFRFLDLAPGRYQVKATRDGFEPFARGEIELTAGGVLPLEFMMREFPATPGERGLPRPPELGTRRVRLALSNATPSHAP